MVVLVQLLKRLQTDIKFTLYTTNMIQVVIVAQLSLLQVNLYSHDNTQICQVFLEEASCQLKIQQEATKAQSMCANLEYFEAERLILLAGSTMQYNIMWLTRLDKGSRY